MNPSIKEVHNFYFLLHVYFLESLSKISLFFLKKKRYSFKHQRVPKSIK